MKVLSPEVKGHERTASEPLWKQLFEILEIVRHLQLVACPDSREHQHESLTSPFYESLKHTHEHFSGGVSFHDAETIRLRQVGRLARCWLKKEPVAFEFDAERITSGKLHEWSGRIFVTVDGLLPGMIEGLRAERSRTHEGIQEVFALWQKEKKSFREVYETEKAAYGRNLITLYIRDFQKRKQMAALAARGKMPSPDEILPSQTENLVMSLQNLFDQEVGEGQSTEMLRQFIVSGAINETPFNIISAAMFASLALKAAAGQKEIPNQGTVTDVNIASTLLPYCDAMFMDNKCRALLGDIPREHVLPYPCRVFSPNTGEDFIRYLSEIRDSASPEHLAQIEEVYGPEPLKPPTKIHGVGRGRAWPS
ncbi:MAG: hypothetical protein WB995_03325 [Candidatus Acidiferrales bacterium]